MSAEAIQDVPGSGLATDTVPEIAPLALPDDTETFEDLYEGAPVAYFSTTVDDIITRVNGTLLAWTGYREEELLGRHFTDLLDPGTQLFYETRHVPVLRLEGEIREVALRVLRADGSTLPVFLNSVMVPGPDGRPRSIRTAMFDATDRSQYERDLLAERRAAEVAAARVRVLQNASAAFTESDSEQVLAVSLADIARLALAATDSCVSMLTDRGDLVTVAGHNPLEALVDRSTRRPGRDAIAAAAPVVVTADAEDEYPDVARVLRAAGLDTVAVFPLLRDHIAIGVVKVFFGRRREVDPDAVELVTAICLQAAQSLLRIRLQEQLEHLALHDQLTGLANRARLREDITQSLARASRAPLPLTIMFLDLDGFKPVNDKLGHNLGDDVLREVARRLTVGVRQGDVLGRFGGDEFVVVCQETDREQAEVIAERLRLALVEPYADLPPWIAVSASIGVVVLNPDPERAITTDELLALADDEMYRAKNAGRNRVSVAEL